MFFRCQSEWQLVSVGAFLALSFTSGKDVLRWNLCSALMDLGIWKGECFVTVLTKARSVLGRMLWVTPMLQRICILLQFIFVSNCYDSCTSQSFLSPQPWSRWVVCHVQGKAGIESHHLLPGLKFLDKGWFGCLCSLFCSWLCGLCDGKMGECFVGLALQMLVGSCCF